MLLLATFCLATYIQISESATCASSNPSTGSFLTNPEELSWNANKEATITFDKTTTSIKKQNNDEYKWIISRLHNGKFPSPTIRVVPGETYQLTLINNLDAEPHQSGNKMKDSNITNIHTHGFHISGESPADYIFHVINGGQQTTYVYNVPCDHSGGTMWYHPHHHGSVAIQVGGGAIGAFIIEDNARYETSTSDGVPNWYINLKTDELILVIQAMNLGVVKGWEDTINDPEDVVFEYENNANSAAFYAVNGKYRPTICLEENKYRKLRIVFADAVVPTTSITISSACTVYLLSRDGVLVHGSDNTVPRLLDNPKNELSLSMASRADIAIHCPYSSSGTNLYQIKAAGEIIADLNVIENAGNVLDDLSQNNWHPKRPNYLQSLLDANNAKTWPGQTVNLASNHIMNQQFQDSTTYLNVIYPHPIAVGDVIEWDIDVMSMGTHPFHIHINHFQVQSYSGGGMRRRQMGGGGMGGGGGGMGGGGCSADTSFCKIGDWIDTMDYSGKIRFHVDRFGGRSVMHCHVLEHEDEGAMGTVSITGSDDTSDCTGYQFVAPTPTPTPTCTANGGSCSSGSDCCSGNCSGMMSKSCTSSVISIPELGPEIKPLYNELWMQTNWIVMILIGLFGAVFGGSLVYCYYARSGRDRKGYLQNSDETTDSEVEELSKI